jgi:hypothetical protein
VKLKIMNMKLLCNVHVSVFRRYYMKLVSGKTKNNSSPSCAAAQTASEKPEGSSGA